jgi:signal transduction histidine kinase
MLRRLSARMLAGSPEFPKYRHTVRLRLTLLFGSLFLVSGAALLALTYLLVAGFPAINVVRGPGQHITATRQGSGTPPRPVSQNASAQQVEARLRVVAHQDQAALLQSLLTKSLIALAIMSVICIVLGWFVAGRVLRPLRTMTSITQRISEHNLHERLALDGAHDELKALGDTIDSLLERLEGAFDAQQRFVANASHELRTPVTLEHALLEMVLSDPDATIESFRSTCEEVLSASEQQEQLIEALLTLARSQRGLAHKEPLDLADIATDTVLAHEPAAAARGIRLDADIAPAPLMGDIRLFQRLASNLADNAIRHNVPDGHVWVATGIHAGKATLTVVNSGPVIPPEEVGRLLQPFQRLNGSREHDRDGLGLGLSIVQAIATAHGGSLLVTARPGGGLDIAVRFTAAEDGSSSLRHDQHDLQV